MKTEVRAEDWINLSTSLSASLTFTALLANRRVSQLSDHVSFQLSTWLWSADDTHIVINLHHKATFVVESTRRIIHK